MNKIWRVVLLFVSINVLGSCIGSTESPLPEIPAQGTIEVLIQPKITLLSDKAYNLIIHYEVGGESYYNSLLRFPEWPRGASGVTWGMGYDGGYHTSSGVKSDWFARIDDQSVIRLSKVAGITGDEARDILQSVRDIEIGYDTANNEFREIEVSNEYALTKRTFPGMENLTQNAQGALVATVYNRGSSLTGSSRIDMRKLRDLVPTKNYSAMANTLLHIPITMYSSWKAAGIYDGLKARYEATALLMETP